VLPSRKKQEKKNEGRTSLWEPATFFLPCPSSSSSPPFLPPLPPQKSLALVAILLVAMVVVALVKPGANGGDGGGGKQEVELARDRIPAFSPRAVCARKWGPATV
jgi:hypothetical protein